MKLADLTTIELYELSIALREEWVDREYYNPRNTPWREEWR